MSATVRRRSLDLADLDAVMNEVRRLHHGGYDRAGGWDLAQVCEHLAIGIKGCMDGIPFKAPLFFRLIGPILFKPRIFRTRQLRAGYPAPPALVPADGLDASAAIHRLQDTIDRLKRHAGPLHPSPYLGALTKDEWMQFHSIHASLHLSFLIPK